ncbi:hypothetical protein [Turicimonas muris]|uniref:hypothetical protein n=1 Tax=Turicimonas muris TaxID=1796652 RepID=UPI0032B278CF
MSFDGVMLNRLGGTRWKEKRNTEYRTEFHFKGSYTMCYFDLTKERDCEYFSYTGEADDSSGVLNAYISRIPESSTLDTMFNLAYGDFEEFLDSLVNVLTEGRDDAEDFWIETVGKDEDYHVTYEADFRDRKDKDNVIHISFQVVAECEYSPEVFFNERLVPNRLCGALYEIPNSNMNDWQKLMCIEGIMSAWGYENVSEYTL